MMRRAPNSWPSAAIADPKLFEVWTISNLTVGVGEFHRPAQGRFEGNRATSGAAN